MKPKKRLNRQHPLRNASNLALTLLSRAGLAPRYRKIFAIGYNKTGTSSIDNLFKRVGLNALHNNSWSMPGGAAQLWKHQAFSDGDGAIFADLDRRFPRSKFILNVRDLIDWLDSRLEHIDHATEIGTHRANTYWQATDAAVTRWIQMRNQHHLAVLDYFRHRPDDLLVVNFVRDADAADRICEFIGKRKLAEKPFKRPIPRIRESGKIIHSAMIERALNGLGVPETEWRFDLYCPSLEPAAATPLWPVDTAFLPAAIPGPAA